MNFDTSVVISLPIFSAPGLRVYISTISDGSMRTGGEGEDEANRQKFLKNAGIPAKSVVSAKLVHGTSIEIVSIGDGGKILPETDGLATRARNLYLALTVADCLPIVLYHPEQHVLALLHAGWRGLTDDIVPKAVNTLISKFGINSADLHVYIGPGVEQHHYEVQEDLVKQFADFPSAVELQSGRYLLDLKLIATQQLTGSGVPKANISVSPECTYCESGKYFSFRRDRQSPVKPMLVLAGMV